MDPKRASRFFWDESDVVIHRRDEAGEYPDVEVIPDDDEDVYEEQAKADIGGEWTDSRSARERMLDARVDAVVDEILRKRAETWDETEHPRDEKGRFAEKDTASFQIDDDKAGVTSEAAAPRDDKGAVIRMKDHVTKKDTIIYENKERAIADLGLIAKRFYGDEEVDRLKVHKTASLPKATPVAEKIVKECEAKKEQYVSEMTAIADASGAKLEGVQYCIKGVGSTGRKLSKVFLDINSAYATDPDPDIDEPRPRNAVISMHEAANDLNDSIRFTAIFDDDDYAAGTARMMRGLERAGYRTISFKNLWAKPGQKGPWPVYQGINTTLLAPDGVFVEMQYHTRYSFQVKEFACHHYYEIARLPETPLDIKRRCRRVMQMNSHKIPIPSGAAGVKTPKGLLKIDRLWFDRWFDLSTSGLRVKED